MQVSQKRSGLVHTALISVGVALAILGDSTLYAVLPTQFETVGLSAVAVGLVLSMNRLIRLVSNPLAAHLMAYRSPSRLFLWALVLAAVTSLAWAFPLPIAVLLIARALWGFCWSVLRLTGYLSALAVTPDRRATAFGLFRSIFRVGSLVAAVAAGLLVEKIGFRLLMAMTAAVSALGVPFFLWTNPMKGIRQATTPADSSSRAQGISWSEWLVGFLGSRDNLWINIGSFVQRLLSSLLAGTMGYYLQQRFGGDLILIGAAALSGLLNAWLWACNIVLSPLYGAAMDRWGRRLSLVVLIGVHVAALTTVGFGFALVPTIIAIMLSLAADVGMEVLLDTLAGDEASDKGDSGRALAGYSNWVDIGAALGPIVGYSIGVTLGLPVLYWIGVCLIVVWTVVAYRRVASDRHFLVAAIERGKNELTMVRNSK
ncbi:MAG: MFS transporter [Firmicutes bacterium]|nr:MFS transporter [Bacillota bacterium]